MTGAGLEEVTGFGSEAATDAYGAGAAFARDRRQVVATGATGATRTPPTINTVR